MFLHPCLSRPFFSAPLFSTSQHTHTITITHTYTHTHAHTPSNNLHLRANSTQYCAGATARHPVKFSNVPKAEGQTSQFGASRRRPLAARRPRSAAVAARAGAPLQEGGKRRRDEKKKGVFGRDFFFGSIAVFPEHAVHSAALALGRSRRYTAPIRPLFLSTRSSHRHCSLCEFSAGKTRKNSRFAPGKRAGRFGRCWKQECHGGTSHPPLVLSQAALPPLSAAVPPLTAPYCATEGTALH